MNARFELRCVDAKALYLALSPEYNPDFGYDNDDSIREKSMLRFTVERYACNPMGFHVGYETFTAHLQCHSYDGLASKACNPMDKAWGYIILDHAFDIDIDGPQEEECECGLDWEECECELYTLPDDDFAFQEIDHVLQSVLDGEMPFARFAWDDQGRYWVWEAPNGDILETLWIEKNEVCV